MTIVVHGMHGLGDNLHQRAVMRELLKRDPDVWLESSWVSLYHDLIERGLRIVHKPTHLRTQSKNARREVDEFHGTAPPAPARHLNMNYEAYATQHWGSVVAAMLAQVNLNPLECELDFRLPIPDAWHQSIADITERADGRPIAIYRPTVQRSEWDCTARNPDPLAYYTLFQRVARDHFVISVADLVPNLEWIVSRPITADLELHRGELAVEHLAALFAAAHVVYASPGFAVPLAQAVSTPVICVFGGYENSSSFSAGARYSPYLGIDTLNPCHCFTSNCSACTSNIRKRDKLLRMDRKRYAKFAAKIKVCDKRIDVGQEQVRINEFLERIADYRGERA